jgi:hypothetical protein
MWGTRSGSLKKGFVAQSAPRALTSGSGNRELVVVDDPVQRRSRDLEDPGSLTLVAVSGFQNALDVLALHG